MGLLYIASYLRKHLSADVRIIDALFEIDVSKKILQVLAGRKIDIVGISGLTSESFLAHKIASAVKTENPQMPLVLGGPYPSSDPETALKDKNVDAAVMGEGEETFAELVRIVLDQGPGWKNENVLKQVDGVAFRSNGAVHITPQRKFIENLDFLPLPAWDMIDYRKFWKVGGMATVGIRPYMPIITSRGCPYHCLFCHNLFGKAFRGRSPESVAEEVAVIHKSGAREIEVLDDIVNFNPERFNRMLELLLERNLRSVLHFPNAIRADIIQEESLDLLKQVGAGEVSVAVETASERLQKLLKKNLNLEKVNKTIDMMAKRRIFTRGFFILGLPDETEEEMLSTIRFAHNSNLHFALFFNPNPYPGTEMYDMFNKAGRMPSDVSSIDFEYFGAPFNASHVSGKRYRMLYRRAYYGFYLNPGRAWRIARDGPFGWDIPLRAVNLFRHYTSFRRLKESE